MIVRTLNIIFASVVSFWLVSPVQAERAFYSAFSLVPGATALGDLTLTAANARLGINSLATGVGINVSGNYPTNTLQLTDNTNGSGIGLITGAVTGRLYNSGGGLFLQTTTNHPFGIFTNNLERARFETTGDLTINATNGGNIVLSRGSTAVAQTAVNNITAAGTTQTDATALTGVVNVITTAAAGTGVRLWEAPAGSFIYIYNGGASNVNVYPPTGGQITGYALNAAAVLATGGASGVCWKRAASGANSWVCFESPLM